MTQISGLHQISSASAGSGGTPNGKNGTRSTATYETANGMKSGGEGFALGFSGNSR